MKLLTLSLIVFLPLAAFSQNAKKVLIIGVDGCRPDAMEVAATPNIDNLISNGLFSPDALNNDITYSGPGWSAILCGVWSDKHLVTNNVFAVDDFSTYPPIFKRVEDFNPALNTVSICHWAPINDNIVQSYADIAINVTSDVDVSSEAVNLISNDDPDVMFLHYDDADHIGHSFGFSPSVPEYVGAIEVIDVLIGQVIDEISLRPNYVNEDWLILVTTDHGGIGTSHGGNTLEEERVFVIASGDNVASSLIERDSTVVPDTAFNCMSDTVELNFDGIDDYVQISHLPIYDFGATQDFTIECRVRTSVAEDVSIIGNKDWDSGSNEGFTFSFKYASGPEWKVNIGDGGNRVDINTGGQIADNEWHTLSVTFDRDGMMKMYEDGTLLDSADISGIGDISTGDGLFFGADVNNSFNFQGSIAEVRCWNTVLDAQTVQDWHCTRVNGSHPNFADMIGYWVMNDGVGQTTVRDYSPNLNNGIIVGPTWYVPDSIVTYDFSATPRIVDVPVTAMTHMCIPIDSAWALDGTSLIPNCVTGVEDDVSITVGGISVFPNPAMDIAQIRLTERSAVLQIFSVDGRMIEEHVIRSGQLDLDIHDYPSGVYIVQSLVGNKTLYFNKLIKQ